MLTIRAFVLIAIALAVVGLVVYRLRFADAKSGEMAA